MFRSCFLVLFISIAGGLLILPGHKGLCAAAVTPDKTCSINDFSSFLEKYSELSFGQQTACIRFPLEKNGKKIHNAKQLSESFDNGKLVYSPRDLRSPEAKPATLFFDIGNDSSAGKDFFGYFIEHIDSVRKKATFTEGGTFELNTVTFEWDGTSWRVVEYRDDNESYQ